MRWQGDVFEPLPSEQAHCNDTFTVGAIYKFEPVYPRSMNSHRHMFAFIREGYDQLPEEWAQQFENAEHLRAWLLIMERYANVEEFQFDTPRDMETSFHLAQKLARLEKSYAIIRKRPAELRYFVITPKSMSQRNMPPAEFREAKNKLLARLSSMIGITPEELRDNAGRAA